MVGPFDNVLLAVGLKPVNTLEASLEGLAEQVSVIGDAKGVRKALEAIEEGYETALNL